MREKLDSANFAHLIERNGRRAPPPLPLLSSGNFIRASSLVRVKTYACGPAADVSPLSLSLSLSLAPSASLCNFLV